MLKKIQGIAIPLPTPFTSDYKLDEDGLTELVRFSVDNGANGLLVNGSSGEFLSLSEEERQRTIRIVSKECKGKVFIIAGVEMPVTHAAIDEVKRVKKAGADFALVATPYYLKPTVDGIYEHYKRVSEAGVPVLLYNNPFRTDVTLTTQLVTSLAELKNIVGIKQSNVDLNQTSELIQVLGKRTAFIHSYGDAVSLFPGLLLGGEAAFILSTLIIPERIMQLYEATMKKDVDTARKIWVDILPLLKNIGGGVHGEPNPAPVKEALRLIGRPVGPPRLPVKPVTKDTTKLLKKILGRLKLID